jgi:hypothetical protein
MVAVFALAIGCGGTLSGQMATAERVEGAGWWPTKRESRAGFVGPGQCATCHPRQSATQPATSMARTGQRATESDVLREGAPLAFRTGNYSYEIARGPQPTFTVTDGQTARSSRLDWAFGAGRVGQSFLFDRDGKLHEARVSYYDAVKALDFTPNRALAAPRDVDEAMSRPIDTAETRRCFGCHTTASAQAGGGIDFAALIPGVTCEACHGPGRRHIAAAKQGNVREARAAIVNPRTLDAVDSIDFCGSCHATFWDVKLADERGIAALRSQPFRLQSSRCWTESTARTSQDDKRLTCAACHDPHAPLVREIASYDERCLACHVATGSPTASHPGRPCKSATSSCAGCHMPAYEVPGMHFKFTDHLIRIVR